MLMLMLFGVLLMSSMTTTKAVYLWNKEASEKLAEIDRDSLVIKINGNEDMTYVFYPEEFTTGYIKSEYLTNYLNNEY